MSSDGPGGAPVPDGQNGAERQRHLEEPAFLGREFPRAKSSSTFSTPMSGIAILVLVFFVLAIVMYQSENYVAFAIVVVVLVGLVAGWIVLIRRQIRRELH